MRVLRDVIAHRNGDDWIAISREPATAGETLVLHVDQGDERHRITVCVVESRPVIVEGDMRHWIRLQADHLPRVLFEQQVRRG
jgi:hypothetical protein